MYSLGALLYELICAAPPWTQEQERRISAGRAFVGQPQPMQQFRPGVPPEVEQLVSQMLAFEPIARPDAEELAAILLALAPTLDNVPVSRLRELPYSLEETTLNTAASDLTAP